MKRLLLVLLFCSSAIQMQAAGIALPIMTFFGMKYGAYAGAVTNVPYFIWNMYKGYKNNIDHLLIANSKTNYLTSPLAKDTFTQFYEQIAHKRQTTEQEQLQSTEEQMPNSLVPERTKERYLQQQKFQQQNPPLTKSQWQDVGAAAASFGIASCFAGLITKLTKPKSDHRLYYITDGALIFSGICTCVTLTLLGHYLQKKYLSNAFKAEQKQDAQRITRFYNIMNQIKMTSEYNDSASQNDLQRITELYAKYGAKE